MEFYHSQNNNNDAELAEKEQMSRMFLIRMTCLGLAMIAFAALFLVDEFGDPFASLPGIDQPTSFTLPVIGELTLEMTQIINMGLAVAIIIAVAVITIHSWSFKKKLVVKKKD